MDADPPAPADADPSLAVDVAEAVAGLPPHLRALAERLRTDGLTAAARAVGIGRSTAYEWAGRIRAVFAAQGFGEKSGQFADRPGSN